VPNKIASDTNFFTEQVPKIRNLKLKYGTVYGTGTLENLKISKGIFY